MRYAMQWFCVLCQNKETINYNCRLDMHIFIQTQNQNDVQCRRNVENSIENEP